MQVDARGRSCPEPVLLAREALAEEPEKLEVIVDNNTARNNVRRLAENLGYAVEVVSEGADYVLVLKK